MSNSSSAIQSWVGGRSQHVVGGVLGVAGVLHFLLWTRGGDGAAFLTDLNAGQLSQAVSFGQEYFTTHPAYPVLFLLGVAIIVRASRQ